MGDKQEKYKPGSENSFESHGFPPTEVEQRLATLAGDKSGGGGQNDRGDADDDRIDKPQHIHGRLVTCGSLPSMEPIQQPRKQRAGGNAGCRSEQQPLPNNPELLNIPLYLAPPCQAQLELQGLKREGKQ